MTTNVYDQSAALLTSDSRWSTTSDDKNWIAFVDDTGFDKIIYDEQLAFLFAGDLALIDEWKKWVRAGRDDSSIPLGAIPNQPTRRVSILQVNIRNGHLEYGEKTALSAVGRQNTKSWFAGTGGYPARECWLANACARKAIGTASTKDPFTGGKVVFYNRKKKAGNVRKEQTEASVRQQLKDRGYLMHKDGAIAPVLLTDAANNPNLDPIAKDLVNRVMAGKDVPLTAPFPGMDEPWTDAEQAELRAALIKFKKR